MVDEHLTNFEKSQILDVVKLNVNGEVELIEMEILSLMLLIF